VDITTSSTRDQEPLIKTSSPHIRPKNNVATITTKIRGKLGKRALKQHCVRKKKGFRGPGYLVRMPGTAGALVSLGHHVEPSQNPTESSVKKMVLAYS